MKKKPILEKLSNEELFDSFENHKLQTLTSSNLRGGTSTTLCATDEGFLDRDTEGPSAENLKDKSCQPVTPPGVPD